MLDRQFEKWKEGKLERTINVGGKEVLLTAERVGVSGTGYEVVFDWGDDTVAFSEVLEAIGELPIPPYLNRETEASDLKPIRRCTARLKVRWQHRQPVCTLLNVCLPHLTIMVLNAMR